MDHHLHLSPGDSLRERQDLYSCLHSSVKFGNAYVLGDFIAEGSFGTVYFTHHVSTKEHPDPTQYAVKVIERDPAGEADKEAIHETTMMRRLRQVPHVIQVKDFYMDKEKLYIVQDLAMGGDVFDRLASRDTYTEKDARELCLHLITTVGYVHDHRILHRDLKPENLLLETLEDHSKIMLCDFGLAKGLPDNLEEGFTTMCGTAAYTAPEIIEGKVYREKVDIWAVGCIMYMLLSGYLPFGESDDSDVLDRIIAGDYDFKDENWDFVSGSARKLISKMLEPEAEDRFTIKEALKSRWFTECEDELSHILLEKSLYNLKRVVTRRKLKSGVKALISSSRLLDVVSSQSLFDSVRELDLVE